MDIIFFLLLYRVMALLLGLSKSTLNMLGHFCCGMLIGLQGSMLIRAAWAIKLNRLRVKTACY